MGNETIGQSERAVLYLLTEKKRLEDFLKHELSIIENSTDTYLISLLKVRAKMYQHALDSVVNELLAYDSETVQRASTAKD